MTRKLSKKNKKNLKRFAIVIVVCLVAWGLYSLFTSPASPFTTTPSSTSTFKLISYVDGEDVSNFVEISVWVPKDTAEFDEVEDIYTMSNFEEDKSSLDAEDVSIDLSDYTYVWIEIDPDAEEVFDQDYYLLTPAGVNYAYSLFVYHQSSDVNFNLLTSTLDEVTVGNYSTNGNFTIIMDCPHSTFTNNHYGTNWEVEASDFADYSANEKEFMQDEKNWRCQAPIYDPTVDTEKDYAEDLEQLTNAFAFKFDFNASISTEDGNTAQVNFTLASGTPADVVISGDLIYVIFTDIISFEDGSQSMNFEMQFGSAIGLDDVDSGRIVVPKDDDALGTFTKYSDLGA